MRTRIFSRIAVAALVACAIPAVSVAGDEHGTEAEHACEHPKTGTVTFGDPSATGSRVVIPVAGMHCSMCAERVTAALSGVKGVKWVETSLDAKQAAVIYDRSKAKPKALAAAVKGAGYEPGKPKAN
jgi:copper chaperone